MISPSAGKQFYFFPRKELPADHQVSKGFFSEQPAATLAIKAGN
jgi:hypothetical protein